MSIRIAIAAHPGSRGVRAAGTRDAGSIPLLTAQYPCSAVQKRIEGPHAMERVPADGERGDLVRDLHAGFLSPSRQAPRARGGLWLPWWIR